MRSNSIAPPVPLDWYLHCGVLVLASLILIIAPDLFTRFILSLFTGQPIVPATTAQTSLAPGNFAGTDLDTEQVQNAAAIINKGEEMGASDRDITIALMAALQESTLRNLEHGDDWWFQQHGEAKSDSVGLFQQRESWGSKAARLDPELAAQLFFESLFQVVNRDALALNDAAQMVQKSAFPDEYAKWQPVAEALLQSSKKDRSIAVGSAGADPKTATFRIDAAVGFSVGNGKALTANHVIEAVGRSGTVETAGGQTCTFSTIKADKSLDLALLQLDGACAVLPGVHLTTAIHEGDAVKASGTPQGGEFVETSGAVVAIGSISLQGNPDVQVTTAMLKPGMSGGPCYLASSNQVFGVVSNGAGQGAGDNWCAEIPAGWVDES